MNNKETGGPAFPVHPDMAAQLGCVPSSSDAGMSLRDYFAAKALTVYWSGPDALEASDDIHAIAGWCYCMADAMLKAREA
jgi:hypothetical protein